jgi:hypothetical protein
MTRVGLLHGIHGKEADRIRHPVVFIARDHDYSAGSGCRSRSAQGTA